MSWFKRQSGEYESGEGPNGAADAAGRTVRTEGLWIKCVGCRAVIWKADLEANLNVCPKCQHHFKIGARQRIGLLLDPGYELVDGGLRSTDPLNFTDIKSYKSRLKKAREAIYSGEWDMVILDEINYAIGYGMLDPAVVAEALRGRPEMVHVILTGRNAHPLLVELADTVTEMREVKHAYQKGIKAQRGIEY